MLAKGMTSFALGLAGVAAAIGAAEFALRLAGRTPRGGPSPSLGQETLHQPDERLGWRNRPGERVWRAPAPGFDPIRRAPVTAAAPPAGGATVPGFARRGRHARNAALATRPRVRESHEMAVRRVHREMPTRPGSGLPPFERVVELYGPALLRYCAAQAGAQRADDCFQETMLAALRAYAGVRDPGALRSWLFSIAFRKAIDLHRERARAPEPVEDLEALAAAGAPALRDEALWARVRELPEKQRQAVTLRYLAGLSHKEIAGIMETTDAAARRNVFEGLARLRKEVRS